MIGLCLLIAIWPVLGWGNNQLRRELGTSPYHILGGPLSFTYLILLSIKRMKQDREENRRELQRLHQNIQDLERLRDYHDQRLRRLSSTEPGVALAAVNEPIPDWVTETHHRLCPVPTSELEAEFWSRK